MEINSTSDAWRLRFATLSIVGGATGYVLLGAGIVQSESPKTAACISAGGLGLLAYAVMLGGVALLACWARAATAHKSDARWLSRWKLPGTQRRALISMKDLRLGLAMLANIGAVSGVVIIVSTMFAGVTVAHRVADGKCGFQPPAAAASAVTQR